MSLKFDASVWIRWVALLAVPFLALTSATLYVIQREGDASESRTPSEPYPSATTLTPSPVQRADRSPLLTYENDSYYCPSFGQPRLVLYASGLALSTGPMECASESAGAAKRPVLRRYQLATGEAQRIMRDLARLGLAGLPTTSGFQASSEEPRVYIEASSARHRFSVTASPPSEDWGPILNYLDSLLGELQNGKPFTPSGAFVEFAFGVPEAACRDGVKWQISDIDLSVLSATTNHLYLRRGHLARLARMAPPFTWTSVEPPGCNRFRWRPLYPHER